LFPYVVRSSIVKIAKDKKYDLIIVTTPPIMYAPALKRLKKLNPSCKIYLLQKDFFPKEAIDLGVLSETNGFKSIIYKFFRYYEQKLYITCDYIGVMSEKKQIVFP
jgi:hypothetical protein